MSGQLSAVSYQLSEEGVPPFTFHPFTFHFSPFTFHD